MKRATFCAVFAIVLALATPQPAHANLGAFFDWLGELSGPGPFVGIAGEVTIACVGTFRRLEAGGSERERTEPRIFRCFAANRDRPRVNSGFAVSRMKAVGDDQPSDKDVHVTQLLWTIDGTLPFVKRGPLLRVLRVGAAAGGIRFASADKRFSAFWKPDVALPSITVLPFAWKGTEPYYGGWADVVQLRVVNKIIGGATANQFGPLAEKAFTTHSVWSAGVGFDLSALLH